MAEQRARGWYWVRISTYWMPVLWDQGAWVLHHSDFDEIGPRAIPPSAAPSQQQDDLVRAIILQIERRGIPHRMAAPGESEPAIDISVANLRAAIENALYCAAPSQPQPEIPADETAANPAPPPSVPSDVAPDRGINRGNSPVQDKSSVYEMVVEAACRFCITNGTAKVKARQDLADAVMKLTPWAVALQQQDLVAASVFEAEPGQPSNPAVARFRVALEYAASTLENEYRSDPTLQDLARSLRAALDMKEETSNGGH